MGTSATFESLRSHLLGVAYRLLGSVTDAEDAVQDAWLRWSGVDEQTIITPKAWLSTTVGRLCLDRLTSAQARRQVYVGHWLPEPVVTHEPLDVESISLGFLLLLERLSPLERVAFVLHQVFDFSHAEIAEALGSNDAAVRQAFHRAQQQLARNRPRFAASPESHARLLNSFMAAVRAGDVAQVQSLLVEDALSAADGGGKVRGAGLKPVRGARDIARLFVGLTSRLNWTERSFELRNINGWPALVGKHGDRLELVITIETDGERIFAIRNILNPDKLSLKAVD